MHCAQCVSASSTEETARIRPHTATIPQSCKPAHRGLNPPQIASLPGAAAPFVAAVRKDKPAPPPHSRSVALRKTTWYDAFLRLITAQPHSPGSRGLSERPRERSATFNLQNRPTYTDAPCSHARVWLQVPGEAEEALPVSPLQQGDAGAGPSVYLWTSVLWHLSARIPQVRGVFVCSHEAGDTGGSFGRATVNNGCVGVSSPFPQPPSVLILLWWPRQHVTGLQGLFHLHLLRKNAMKDTTDVSRRRLSGACHCSAEEKHGFFPPVTAASSTGQRNRSCHDANAANVQPRR